MATMRMGVIIGFATMLSARVSTPPPVAPHAPTADQMAAWTPQQRCQYNWNHHIVLLLSNTSVSDPRGYASRNLVWFAVCANTVFYRAAIGGHLNQHVFGKAEKKVFLAPK
jgi:hypothetical protein